MTNSNPGHVSFHFTCGPPEGAALALPHGASRMDLVSRTQIEDYVKDNMLSWCKKMQEREDLVIVTGADKCSSWGTACYSHATESSDIYFSCLTTDGHSESPPTPEYAWSISDSVQSRSGRCTEEVLSENQCIFIRGFKAKFRKISPKTIPAKRVPIRDDVQSDTDSPGQPPALRRRTNESWVAAPQGGNHGGIPQSVLSDSSSDAVLTEDFPGPNEASNIPNNGEHCNLSPISPSIHWISSIRIYCTLYDNI